MLIYLFCYLMNFNHDGISGTVFFVFAISLLSLHHLLRQKRKKRSDEDQVSISGFLISSLCLPFWRRFPFRGIFNVAQVFSLYQTTGTDTHGIRL